MDVELESLRADGRIDISTGIDQNIIIKDEIENDGARNKFWFNNYKYLFKEIYLDSYEDYAEIISSEIASELDIDCAYYDLAIYKGKNGVITRNFVDEDNGEELISGTVIINEVYQKHIQPLILLCERYFQILAKYNLDITLSNLSTLTLSKQKELLKEVYELYTRSKINAPEIAIYKNGDLDNLSNTQINSLLLKFHDIFNDLYGMYDKEFIKIENSLIKANNVFDLWSVIENYCHINGFNVANADKIINKLINLLIFDIITSQGDRHSNNWGLIVNKNNMTLRLAPLYDNSNMCNLNRGKALKTIHGYIERLETNLPEVKRGRIENRLKESINHAKSCLKIVPEDIGTRSNNITMLSELFNMSNEELKNEVIEKIKRLSQENLQNIFRRIENRLKISIPEEIKDVVLKTIEINITEILNIINKDEVNYEK